jgi:hypothetical protein
VVSLWSLSLPKFRSVLGHWGCWDAELAEAAVEPKPAVEPVAVVLALSWSVSVAIGVGWLQFK